MAASLYQSGSLLSFDLGLRAMLRPLTDAPNGERKFRIEPNALMLSAPHDVALAHQVFGPQRVVVGQAKFPERNFDIRFLRGDGIETDRNENDILPVGARLFEEHDVLVPGVLKRQAD